MFHGDLLGERARLTPDKTALVYVPTGERLTYGGTAEPATAESVAAGRTTVKLVQRYPPEINHEGWPRLMRRLVSRVSSSAVPERRALPGQEQHGRHPAQHAHHDLHGHRLLLRLRLHLPVGLRSLRPRGALPGAPPVLSLTNKSP